MKRPGNKKVKDFLFFLTHWTEIWNRLKWSIMLMAVGRAVVWGHHQHRSYRVWPIIFLATQCSQCRPGLPIQTVLSSVSRTWCKYPDRHLPTSPPSTNQQTINPCLGSEFLPWTAADIPIPGRLIVNNLILFSPTPKSDFKTCISGKWLWAWA